MSKMKKLNMTEQELKKELRQISAVNSGVVNYYLNDMVSVDGVFSIDELRKIAGLVQRYLNSQQPEEVEEVEEDNPDLSRCPNCDGKAWDGRICHICGAKNIGE
jgi:hypothetical protein